MQYIPIANIYNISYNLIVKVSIISNYKLKLLREASVQLAEVAELFYFI